jgi:hypothetical protein
MADSNYPRKVHVFARRASPFSDRGTTSSAGSPAHTHMIMLAPADLATLRGGGMVQIESTKDSNHTHTYQISCT